MDDICESVRSVDQAQRLVREVSFEVWFREFDIEDRRPGLDHS